MSVPPRDPWYPLPSCAIAIAKAAYHPAVSTLTTSLPLRLGDTVLVFEQSAPENPEWYRGYLISPAVVQFNEQGSSHIAPQIFIGAFPVDRVAFQKVANTDLQAALYAESNISPTLANASTASFASLTDASLSEGHNVLPVVNEIAAVLREWFPEHTLALFSSSTHNYSKLNTIAALISELSATRKKLLQNILTSAETHDAVRTAVWSLIRGNKLLSGDVIVRSELDGHIRTGEDGDDNIISLFKDQEAMALSTHNTSASAAAISGSRNAAGGAAGKNLLQLTARLKSVNGSWTDGMFAKVYLCDKHKIVSESFVTTGGQLDQCALFVDLPLTLASDDALLVVEVYETIYMTTQIVGNEHIKTGSPQGYTIKARRGVGLGVVDMGRILRQVADVDRDLTIRLFTSSSGPGVNRGWGSLRDSLVRGNLVGIQRSPKIDRLVFSVRAFEAASSSELIASKPSLFTDLVSKPRTIFTTSTTIRRDELYLTLGGMRFLSHLITPETLYFVTLSSENSNSPLKFFSDAGSEPLEKWVSAVVSRDESLAETVYISPLVQTSDVVVRVHMADGKAIGQALFKFWNDGIIIKDGIRDIQLTDSQGIVMGSIDIKSIVVSTEISSDESLLTIIRWRTARIRRGEEDGTKKLLTALKQLIYVDANEISKLLQESFDAFFGILAWKIGDKEFEDAVMVALVHVLNVVVDKKEYLLIEEYISGRFNYPSVIGPLVYSVQRLLSRSDDGQVGSTVREFFNVGRYIFRLIDSCWAKYQARDSISINLIEFRIGVFKIYEHLGTIFGTDPAKLTKTGLLQDADLASTVETNQILILQHFPEYIGEIRSIAEEADILKLVIDFVGATASSCKSSPRMTMYRLMMLQSLSRCWIFTSSSSTVQHQLVLNTVEWIRPYMVPASDADVVSTPTWQAWKDRIRACCAVLSTQFSILWPTRVENADTCVLYVRLMRNIAAVFMSVQQERKNSAVKTITSPKFKNEYSPLFPSDYPFPPNKPVDTSIKKLPFDELSVELCCMLAVTVDFSRYEGNSSSEGETLTEEEAIELMRNILKMCDAVLKGKGFPKVWFSIYMIMHNAVLASLQFISLILLEYFIPSGSQDSIALDEGVAHIWFMFFERLLDLASSDALRIEDLPEQKRGIAIACCNEVRDKAAELLVRMWNAIGHDADEETAKMYDVETFGGLQSMFISKSNGRGIALTGKVIGLWRSKHSAVRAAASHILKSMIISEWTTSHTLDNIRSDIVDALDYIFQTKNYPMHSVDESMKKSIFEPMHETFLKGVTNPELATEARQLLGTVAHVLDLFVDLHSLPENDGYSDDRIERTLTLMESLRDINREDTFVHYVHQLIRIQEASGHFVEAGLTLGLHAKIFPWRMDIEVPAISDPEMPAQTAFQRRETLCLHMIRYYTIGGAPELALSTYKELAEAYETVSFELDKLADTMSTMSKLYKEELSSAVATRPLPQYFRVCYSGLGFHQALRGKQFIIQGNKWEKLTEFRDRIQKIYPHAKISSASSTTASSSASARHLSVVSQMSSASQVSAGDSLKTLDASLTTIGAETEGQHVTITAVTPEPSQQLAASIGTPSNVRDFLLGQNLRRFSLARPIKSDKAGAQTTNSNNPVDIWIDKTTFETRDSFPTILRRSEIVSVETILVSPMTNAADDVSRKTSEILSLARRAIITPNDEMNSSQLGMTVSGAVDAPVNGGIQVYRNLLEVYENDYEEDLMNQKEQLRGVIVDYAAVLLFALNVHSKVVASALRPLHDSLVVLFYKNFATEIHVIEDEGRYIDGVNVGTISLRRADDRASLALSPQFSSVTNASTEHTLGTPMKRTVTANTTTSTSSLTSKTSKKYPMASPVVPPLSETASTTSTATTATANKRASMSSINAASITAAVAAATSSPSSHSSSTAPVASPASVHARNNSKIVEKKTSSLTLGSLRSGTSTEDTGNSVYTTTTNSTADHSTKTSNSLASRMGRRFSKIKLSSKSSHHSSSSSSTHGKAGRKNSSYRLGMFHEE
ncbi:uncharacterized protein V1516DRAFT_664915 [Lipomyces oligophaga]|uniref:uncharacterized protein n=1 Tax=Lipomyces oligophaga TaxID=45792 RepID=UPI0034CDDD78